MTPAWRRGLFFPIVPTASNPFLARDLATSRSVGRNEVDIAPVRCNLRQDKRGYEDCEGVKALSTKGDGAVRPSKKSRQGDSKPCCYNGGLCVLGSFCHCPENFYGRHCEFELKRKTCGHVPHGSWVKAGCNLCQCNDGHMACLPRAFEGCDDLPLKEEIDPWDYKDEMVVFAADDSSKSDYTSDGADYYDYYELENSKKAAAGRTSQNAVCLLLTLLVWWLAS